VGASRREAGVRVYLVDYDGPPSMRGAFNSQAWRPALAKAGVTRPTRDHGMHALRHLYAGESIEALAQYLGHNDPISRSASTRT
jgi:hypothetical protein